MARTTALHASDFRDPGIVCIPLGEGDALINAADLITRIPSNIAVGAQSYAFLCQGGQILEARADISRDVVASLIRRAGSRPIIFAGFDPSNNSHVLYAPPTSTIQTTASTLSDIRQADLFQLLLEKSERCIISSGFGYHFVTPSYQHCTRFFRIADMFDASEAYERVRFWLMPAILRSDAVIMDSWTIVSLLLWILNKTGKTIPFTCLPQHPRQDAVAAQRTIENLVETANPHELLFLQSISGGGALASFFESHAKLLKPKGIRVRMVNIFGFQQTHDPVETFCVLQSEEQHFGPHQACSLCRDGSKQLKLDPHTFHLRTIAERPVMLLKRQVKNAGGFLLKYGATPGVLRAHRDDPNDGRHHAFDVDVLTLLELEAFRSDFLAKITQIFQGKRHPDVIVLPVHPAAQKLVDLLESKFNVPIILSNSLRASEVVGNVEPLRRAKCILFVDDVINTGSRYSQFNRALREEGYDGHLERVVYFAAIARSTDADSYGALVKSLTEGHPWQTEVATVESLYLPNWGAPDCPWCREVDFLSSWSRTLAEPSEWLRNRLSQLRNRSMGLRDSPILLFEGVNARVFGGGSPVFPAGANAMLTLFLAVAGLQGLRHEPIPEKRLDASFPLGNTFALGNLTERWTEGLLRACLLKVVRPREWGAAEFFDLVSFLKTCVRTPDQDQVWGEVFLAFGVGWLPDPPDSEFRELFNPLLKDDIESLLGLFRMT